MSFGVSVPTLCSELENIPLPCSKELWEAETKSGWESEYKKYLSSRSGVRIPKVGDLVHSNESDVDSLELDMVNDLSDWSKAADSISSLLLLCSISGL